MNDCIFCKIIDGEMPCNKVYEDEYTLAFMDIMPINPGHVLVIPKSHAQLIIDVEDQFLEKMMLTAKKVNKAIRESDVQAEGVNLFLSDGSAAGQEVFHAHLHLIPRFTGDGFGLRLPGGSRNTAEKESLAQIAENIQGSLIK